ncbi:hypothetical protein BKA82DRAFT_1003202 [Pisolithus tinctorius]|uniref:Uncharacterized protein n=1 Tax=Pisolithus tinctorius Marx 270 TaxID=870435 RepID=A0A0C3JUY8_PISTI|nr:hypothetical protein BKA82DRAFT_1003202 [Pisolithus tinctorius]KIO01272.1 hypothetical protein M404DRAFT_1003202 [Pisolithus tinctorius Marx 270]
MAREMRPDKWPSPQSHAVSLDGSKRKPELLNAGHPQFRPGKISQYSVSRGGTYLVRSELSTASCDDYMCRYRIIHTCILHASERHYHPQNSIG